MRLQGSSRGALRPWGLAVAAAVAVVLAVGCLAVRPGVALADGGLFVTGASIVTDRAGTPSDVQVTEGEAVRDAATVPNDTWYIVLAFDKNVSYARPNTDGAFVQENLGRVHLRRADTGEEAPFSVRPGGTMEERQLLYVTTDDWLEPLCDYELVVDAGVTAANGEDVLDEPYVLRFTTADGCANGLTVAQNVLLVVAPLVLLAGVAVAVVRRVRAR